MPQHHGRCRPKKRGAVYSLSDHVRVNRRAVTESGVISGRIWYYLHVHSRPHRLSNYSAAHRFLVDLLIFLSYS